MNFPKHFCSLLVVFVASVMGLARLAAQGTEEKPIVTAAATAKFGAVPNAPACFTIAVERGDPTKGPSVILARSPQDASLRSIGIPPAKLQWSSAGLWKPR